VSQGVTDSENPTGTNVTIHAYFPPDGMSMSIYTTKLGLYKFSFSRNISNKQSRYTFYELFEGCAINNEKDRTITIVKSQSLKLFNMV